jgi:ATP-dependent helicase/nuclease subunit A
MTGAPSPAGLDDDQPARDRIRRDLDDTLFVEAGAGTGKTTALVERIVELVATGRAELRSVAAITFTEAAAGELRDRVRQELERVAEADTGERGRRAAAAVAEIDAAVLTTLHGFAQRILAEHPFEAGLPPTFEVFDEIRSAVAFDERWQAFLDELLDDEAMRPTLQRALVADVRLDHLRSVARELNRNWDLVVDHPPAPVEPPPIDAAPVVDRLQRAASFAALCRDPGDKLFEHLSGLEGYTRRMADAATDLEVLELLTNAPRLTAPGGRKENWDGHADDIKALLSEANSAKDGIVEAVVQAALADLLVGLADLTVRAAEERRREGGLEFHDLLVQARALLRTHPEVTARLHATYTHLLIDEFQDTDPIQLELAVRIASDGPPDGDAASDWHDWPVPPGRLFFVGDPKQAIYRFRRADVAVFLEARRTYVDEAVQLTRNHRSVPAIVDWVNAVFTDLIGDGTAESQPAYAPLAAYRPPPDGDDGAPAVLLMGDAHDERMSEVRAAEASELAATIARIRDDGWSVGDGDGRRPARLADVTVLIPTRASLSALERALDRAGLPYRVESSSLVYASPEVRDLLHVLRAVDDPTDQISVVASLRSPWFGCGDDDLLEFHQAGGRWDPRPDPPASLADDHPVVAGLRSLKSLHDRRWWHDASGLIELVLVERRAYELGLDERRPRDTWRRLRFVVDQARAFTDAYGADLRHYLAWADLQSADDARVVEAILPDTDDDAVRIMTVHASKGLEFPVVVLAGLNTEDRPVNGVDVLWGRSGAEVKLVKGKATAGYAGLAAGESVHQAAEQIRLLYVAATRARDHLVVSLHRKEKTNSHAQRLAPICTALADDQADDQAGDQLDPPPAPSRPPATTSAAVQLTLAVEQPRPVDVPPRDAGALAAERERWMLERIARLEEAESPRTIAATSVVRLARGGADAWDDLAEELDPAADDGRGSARRGRAGTAVGRAVHAVLQVVDLATGAQLAELSQAQAAAEGVADRAAEVERLAKSALDAEVVRGAVAGGRFWRELYVGAPVGDRVLEGFVDLLIEEPDGLTVVDYKTDAARTEGDLDRAVARYRLQAAAYAVAVEQVLGRPVGRGVLLFLRPNGAVAREVTDLTSAKAEVQAVLARTARPPHPH